MNPINNNLFSNSIIHVNEFPSEILHFIFSLLEPKDKQVGVQVCKMWNVTIIEVVRNSEIKCYLAFFTKIYLSQQITPPAFWEIELRTEPKTLKDFQTLLTTISNLLSQWAPTAIIEIHQDLHEAHSNTFFYKKTVMLALQNRKKDEDPYFHLYMAEDERHPIESRNRNYRYYGHDSGSR